jgi:hypothetical protein
MTEINIEGEWTGYFQYGRNYPVDYIGKMVAFVIHISMESGLIKGTCLDSLAAEFCGVPAIIEGEYSKNRIQFEKTYSSLLFIDENNINRSASEKSSCPVHYRGELKKTLFSDSFYFTGEWTIEWELPDTKQTYTFDGTWFMHRVMQSRTVIDTLLYKTRVLS